LVSNSNFELSFDYLLD